MFSSIFFSLGLFVIVSSTAPKQNHTNNCGSHPNDAMATLSVEKSPGSIEKICTVIIVKNNVAVGSNCNVDKHESGSLYISVASEGNKHLNVTHVRIDTIPPFQFFYFENDQQLKKVCLNISDLKTATELFSLKQCNDKNVASLTPRSYMLSVKDANQKCQFNISSQVILASCSGDVACSRREFYGFAKVNNAWSLIGYDFESGAPSSTSKSEETFETTQMEDFIQYLFDETNSAHSDEFLMDYFDELAKEMGRKKVRINNNNSSSLKNELREHLKNLEAKKNSDSLRNDLSEHLKNKGSDIKANQDLLKDDYNEYIKSLESPMDGKKNSDSVEDKLKNANLNCKVTHGPNKHQEIKLSCKIVN